MGDDNGLGDGDSGALDGAAADGRSNFDGQSEHRSQRPSNYGGGSQATRSRRGGGVDGDNNDNGSNFGGDDNGLDSLNVDADGNDEERKGGSIHGDGEDRNGSRQQSAKPVKKSKPVNGHKAGDKQKDLSKDNSKSIMNP